MTSAVSTKMMTIIALAGPDTVLPSTATRTRNATIIAMYGSPCISAALSVPGARRALGVPRSCSRAAAASQM